MIRNFGSIKDIKYLVLIRMRGWLMTNHPNLRQRPYNLTHFGLHSKTQISSSTIKPKCMIHRLKVNLQTRLSTISVFQSKINKCTNKIKKSVYHGRSVWHTKTLLLFTVYVSVHLIKKVIICRHLSKLYFSTFLFSW